MADFEQAASQAMAQVRSKLTAVREAQAAARATTGEASSRDGSVRAVVDATGVVTSLVFAPDAYTRHSPERLAQATVATIQAAAEKARAKAAEVMAPAREISAAALAVAKLADPDLSTAAVTPPAVPRTAVDPSPPRDEWHQAPPAPQPAPAQTFRPPAPQPYAAPPSPPGGWPPATQPPAQQPHRPPVRRPVEDDEDGGTGSVFEGGGW